MIPFSLLPHWFQRRYRVWRGLCCAVGVHRQTMDSKPHRLTKGVGYQPPCLYSRCVDCGREGYEHEVVPSPRRTVRRSA